MAAHGYETQQTIRGVAQVISVYWLISYVYICIYIDSHVYELCLSEAVILSPCREMRRWGGGGFSSRSRKL